MGELWEHPVLNEIMAHLQSHDILYWRDKRGQEVHFVLASGRAAPLAVECTWSAAASDSANLRAFREPDPKGRKIVVAHDVRQMDHRNYGSLKVTLESLATLVEGLARPPQWTGET